MALAKGLARNTSLTALNLKCALITSCSLHLGCSLVRSVALYVCFLDAVPSCETTKQGTTLETRTRRGRWITIRASASWFAPLRRPESRLPCLLCTSLQGCASVNPTPRPPQVKAINNKANRLAQINLEWNKVEDNGRMALVSIHSPVLPKCACRPLGCSGTPPALPLLAPANHATSGAPLPLRFISVDHGLPNDPTTNNAVRSRMGMEDISALPTARVFLQSRRSPHSPAGLRC